MLQFPKSTHVTLPSVEQWSTNSNILRDPPKSLFTRRIDKVGQNMDITSLVDSSGDRAAEGIAVYARGVNPMVSVSYSNQSNNAGIAGNPTAISGRTQAYLPYSVMEGGVFRPPIQNPRDLLPLSRLPRVWFGADTQKSAVDYSKTRQQPYDYRAVKEASTMIHAFDVRPNRTADISAKLVDHMKMLDKINDRHINVSATAGTGSRDITSFTRDHVDRTKGTADQIVHAYAQVNPGQSISHNLDSLTIDKSRYIQPVLQAETFANPSIATAQNLDTLDIDEARYIHPIRQTEKTTNRSAAINAKTADQLNDASRRVTVKSEMIQYAQDAGIKPNVTFLNEIAQPVLDARAVPQHSTSTQLSDSTRYHRVAHEREPEFERNLPRHEMTANITKMDDFNGMMLSSREARIHRPDLQKGGFINPGLIPTMDRQDNIELLARRETEKDRLRRQLRAY